MKNQKPIPTLKIICNEMLCLVCRDNRMSHNEYGQYKCRGCTLCFNYNELIKNIYYLVPAEQPLNFWDKLVGRKVKYKWKRVETNG